MKNQDFKIITPFELLKFFQKKAIFKPLGPPRVRKKEKNFWDLKNKQDEVYFRSFLIEQDFEINHNGNSSYITKRMFYYVKPYITVDKLNKKLEESYKNGFNIKTIFSNEPIIETSYLEYLKTLEDKVGLQKLEKIAHKQLVLDLKTNLPLLKDNKVVYLMNILYKDIEDGIFVSKNEILTDSIKKLKEQALKNM